MDAISVAVTGAAGFLGRALVRRLQRDPQVREIVAIDRRVGHSGEKIRWISGDVRSPNLEPALHGVDAVVHLAFVVLGDLREAESINVTGSANVFELTGRAGAKRLVFLSSVAAYGYGPPDRLLAEDDPLRPVPGFVYSQTKAAAERALDASQARYPELEGVRLRPCIIVGPGAHRPLALLARKGLQVTPNDLGSLQLVHVDDVVEACRLAVFRKVMGAFNLTGDGVLTPRELAQLAGARHVPVPGGLLRAGMRVVSRVLPSRGLDVGWLRIARRPPLISAARARAELGWAPTRSTQQIALEMLGYDWRQPSLEVPQ
jgi:nucleoside-diphosphate-sugar epimerase